MAKILCIGAGGIGSWLIPQLDRLINLGQLSAEVFVADFDMVERKNVFYGQNFTREDLTKNKAETICKKYKTIKPLNKKITEVDLKGFDLIVMAVDNNPTRKMVMEYCHKNKKDFIDLRADGRMVFVKSKGENLDKDLTTIDLNDNESGGCQLESDLEKNIIQNGNIVTASLGSQMILNWLRGEENYKLILKV